MYNTKVSQTEILSVETNAMYEKIIEWWQSQCHSQINMCCHYCDKRFEPKTAPTLEAEEARKAWLGATCGIGWHACNEDIPAKRRDARNVRYKWTKTEQCSSSVVQTKGVANRREYTRVEWEVRPNIRFLWWERLSGDDLSTLERRRQLMASETASGLCWSDVGIKIDSKSGKPNLA